MGESVLLFFRPFLSTVSILGCGSGKKGNLFLGVQKPPHVPVGSSTSVAGSCTVAAGSCTVDAGSSTITAESYNRCWTFKSRTKGSGMILCGWPGQGV